MCMAVSQAGHEEEAKTLYSEVLSNHKHQRPATVLERDAVVQHGRLCFAVGGYITGRFGTVRYSTAWFSTVWCLLVYHMVVWCSIV